MEDDHSDTESSQLLGHWDSPPPPPTKGTRGGGRVLPPWAEPSYEWGGGKWKEDGRKKKRKKKDLMSVEDLMNEYTSLPPQIAEWFWCIEYVAKFHNLPFPCLLDLMNMGYPPTNDYGSRINELLSLRILEFLFDPTKNDAAATVFVGPRIEFDCSLSSTHVLNAILKKHIPVSELRPGMPELSNFNALPFIAHKNMSLPLCALEKLRDVWAMEDNRTSSAPTVEVNDHPVYYRDDQPEQRDEQQAHTTAGLEQTNINDADDGVQTNEVVVIDGNDTTAEQQPINNNGNTTRETSSSPSSEMRVKCTKDGAWLICGSDDDESEDMVPPSRPENICWKCESEGGGGLLLICSRSECAAKVHKECLNCQARFDEDDDNFHCPVCWYDRMTMEYRESHKLMSCAKGRLVKFLPLLSRASKRLKVFVTTT
ncbi:hypothetical protein Bca52824_077894 [Brassica carinata]|uniref:Zinc finger PHD-type domain-containing protein n=1 Tax=Brassica carinata TaxID=52824 RepID=A0A8X7TXP4_BRACI|nr:hypothetical protein Bca52824_077894 [Brassica carinata]